MDTSGLEQSANLHDAVLRTVAYADVFDYPLTSAEIHRYLIGVRAEPDEVERALGESSLYRSADGLYTLPGRQALIALRGERERQAGRMWSQALFWAKVISLLPFIRMVAITGSLAMNNVGSEPDIDFFMVTARGRLWMARAMVLALARAAALQGARLCPNYLVTEDALVFPDRTLYAAHELAQMVPLFGMQVYLRVCQANPWKERYLPNAAGVPCLPQRVASFQREAGRQPLKPVLERILRLPPGAWLERWEMQRKIDRLSREQSASPESRFSADTCKGHHLRHGQRTERVLRERLAALDLEALL